MSLLKSVHTVARLMVCSFFALPLFAWSNNSIATDRPDFVESSDVVGQGRVQIETGFSEERDRSGGVKTKIRTTPTLIRIGVSDTLELRVETDGYVRSIAEPSRGGPILRERGFSDVSVGVKWHLQDGDASRGTPGTALLAHLDLDSGSAPFRGPGVRPSLRWVAEWELPQGFSVGLMPGMLIDRNEDGKRFAAGILAATVAKTWSPKWRTFVEIAGQRIASNRNGGNVVTFNAGIVHLFTDTLHIDFTASRGLTDAAPRLQLGAGISTRF